MEPCFCVVASRFEDASKPFHNAICLSHLVDLVTLVCLTTATYFSILRTPYRKSQQMTLGEMVKGFQHSSLPVDVQVWSMICYCFSYNLVLGPRCQLCCTHDLFHSIFILH